MRAPLAAVDGVRVLADGKIASVVGINGNRNLIVVVTPGDRFLVDNGFASSSTGTPTP
ncbi:MAG TPA: hypothetical protein VFX03_05045 [Thermomicrobiales bacterium]|nr:hypothetical protein [Thermomicrobiales bacterium]